MNEEHKSRFDLSQIGEADKHNLCATFLEAIKRFYDDPANRESFERWQQEQQKKFTEKSEREREEYGDSVG